MKLLKSITMFIKYGSRSSSKRFVNYLKKRGVNISNSVMIYSPHQFHIDLQYPFLITIEDGVIFAPGIRIITHDFSWSVLKRNFNEVLGASGHVFIGQNSFIGSETIILKNVKIGKNCIIGAGSLVSKDIPDNTVAAGRPAKPIMNIEEFYKKRKSRQFNEAYHLFEEYHKTNGEIPSRNIFREYYELFTNDVSELTASEKRLLGNDEISLARFENHLPAFKSFEEFIICCQKKFKERQNEIK